MTMAVVNKNDMPINRDQCSYVEPVRTNSMKLGTTKAIPLPTNSVSITHKTLLARNLRVSVLGEGCGLPFRAMQTILSVR